MAKIKPLELTFIVKVTVVPIDPQDFSTDQEFRQNDGKAMIGYLKDKIEVNLQESWQYAAKVSDVKVTRK